MKHKLKTTIGSLILMCAAPVWAVSPMSDQETNSVINTIKMQNAQANNIVPVVDTTDESLLPPPAKHSKPTKKPKAGKHPRPPHGPPLPPEQKEPRKKPKAGERPEPPPPGPPDRKKPRKKPKAGERPEPPPLGPPDRKKPRKKPKAGERPEPPPAPPSNN